MYERTREILGWYEHENPGVRTNLARLLNHGKLAGTGKVLIMPVDQGFEIGPARSFAANPQTYDPRYHIQFAVEAGLSAYAAPRGFLEAGISNYCGEIPLILKCNSLDSLTSVKEFDSAVTASINAALQLGCVGIGFTIFTGSAKKLQMYQQLSEMAIQAKQAGLVVVVWSYAVGNELKREDWKAVDSVAYTAHLAAQLGANIIKLHFPTSRIGSEETEKFYQRHQIPVSTAADRVRHIVKSAFNGRRLVIFAGGMFTEEEQLLTEVRAIKEGGAAGSIIGRNLFQRNKEDAYRLIDQIVSLYK